MTRKRKSRKGLYLFLIILFLGASAAYFQFKTKKEVPEKVAIEAAQKRTIIETVYSSGKLFPATELEITSNVSGTIIDLFVKEGDLVKKGQLLAKVDPEALVSIVERAEAATEGSKAQLEAVRAQKKQLEAQFDNTKIIFERNKKLHEEGIISKAEFEAAEASFNTSKANIEAAVQNILAAEYTVKSSEATVKEQKKNLSQTRIYAPIAGVVSTLYKKQGEQVVGTAQMAGTPILKIANLKTVEIRVDVNERDILNTIIGDSAEIELDAYPDRKFIGLVTQIANTSTGLKIGRASPRQAEALAEVLKKKCVGSVLPQAEAERPPRARGTWSGVGRRGTTPPTPLCLRSSASSSYLYLVLVSVPGSVSPGAPAAVFVSPSSPASP